MSTIGNVKNQLKTLLDTLVPTYIKSVVITDVRKDPLDLEVGSYPVAFIMPPSFETSGRLDNRTLQREYTFIIMICMRAENLTGNVDVEDLQERIANVLDNSITLAGNAQAGIQPVVSRPEPFQHNGRDLIIFDVIIKARGLETLTF